MAQTLGLEFFSPPGSHPLVWLRRLLSNPSKETRSDPSRPLPSPATASVAAPCPSRTEGMVGAPAGVAVSGASELVRAHGQRHGAGLRVGAVLLRRLLRILGSAAVCYWRRGVAEVVGRLLCGRPFDAWRQGAEVRGDLGLVVRSCPLGFDLGSEVQQIGRAHV